MSVFHETQCQREVSYSIHQSCWCFTKAKEIDVKGTVLELKYSVQDFQVVVLCYLRESRFPKALTVLTERGVLSAQDPAGKRISSPWDQRSLKCFPFHNQGHTSSR